MESPFPVAVLAKDAPKFARLRKIFQPQYFVVDSGRALSGCAVRHDVPSTSIGAVSRSLIFPHAIVRHCQSLWRARRRVHASFCGLLNAPRQRFADEWVARQPIATCCFLESIIRAMRRRWLGAGLGTRVEHVRRGTVLIEHSTRGREFPAKAWDSPYYKMLADTKYALCPPGDYEWSYRFFEAVLCGAIPVVEKPLAIYDGFRFLTLADDVDACEWTLEVAEANFQVCRERVTVPLPILEDEVSRIVNGHHSHP
jgi:hypothetical protein